MVLARLKSANEPNLRMVRFPPLTNVDRICCETQALLAANRPVYMRHSAYRQGCP